MSGVATKKSSISSRKLAANRANAQKSTGPRSAEGKARSSQNSTTHGLFCHAAVLPGENKFDFHGMRTGFMLGFNPQDTVELMLVDRIVLANWKLRRLQESELALNSIDRYEALAAEQSEEDEDEEYLRYRARAAANAYEIPPRITEAEVRMKPDLDAFLNDKHAAPPSIILAANINRDDSGRFERLSRYEQRLENQILRMMRELRQLRKDRQKQEPKAWSLLTENTVKYYDELVQRRDEQKEQKAARAAKTADDAAGFPGAPEDGEGEVSASVAGAAGAGEGSSTPAAAPIKPAARDTSKMKNEPTEPVELNEKCVIAGSARDESRDAQGARASDSSNPCEGLRSGASKAGESGDAREDG